MARTHPFAEDDARPKPRASEGVTPTRHTGSPRAEKDRKFMADPRPGCAAKWLPARRGGSSTPMGWLLARVHAAGHQTASTFPRSTAAIRVIGNLPRSLRSEGSAGRRLAGSAARCPRRRRAPPGRPVDEAPSGREGTRTDERTTTIAPTRAGCRVEQGEPCVTPVTGMSVCRPLSMPGAFACAQSRAGQGVYEAPRQPLKRRSAM
jgi:hypothetical protein